MSGFLRCALYLLTLALLAHPVGQALPRRWFDGGRFPYACYKWEKQGKLYTRIGVDRWKTLVPDMSRILPDMVRKQVTPTAVTAAQAAVLVQETCVAECVHWALTLLSAGIFFLWRSGWAALLWLVYNVLGNVSFIVIQRYNRPRLQKLAEKTRRKPV